MTAKQTPLPDLLDGVPEDIVLGIPGDEPMFPSYTNIPIGKHARQAAAELRRLAAVEAQRDALLEALIEADDLLRIAREAMWKLGLNGLGSDCRLSHEVRMFALDFSAESRDGPGFLQVNGTGRLQKALASNCAAIKAVEEQT